MVLCLNNFIIVGVTNSHTNLVNKISNLTGLKKQEFFFDKNKILVGIQDEECMVNTTKSLLLLHGIFLEETPSSLLNKLINDPEVFTKEYGYQGTLALIDIKEKTIKILGDPLGTRSVFYFVTPGVFIISTDMKLLKLSTQALDIHLEQDVLALYEIVAFGFILSRRTIFKNVFRLLPGEVLDIQVSKGVFEYNLSRYWNMVPIDTSSEKREVILKLLKYLINQLNTLCKEASETKIAIPISGGIDSSLLLLLASKAKGCNQIRAVHVNFENPRELLLSRYISVKVRSPLDIFVTTLLQLRKNYIKVLSNMLKIIGYPREGDSSLPYLILAQFLREKEFALSIPGDDADSIYGGYDYYKFFAIQLLLEKRIPELLELMRILIKHNYSHEKKHSIMLQVFLQFILRFYPIRYQHLKLRLQRLSSIRNKKLKKLIAQYLSELSNILYKAPAHNYYHEMLRKMLIHKASHLVHARVKAEESHDIVAFLPYSLRGTIELIMQISPGYFFFPIGTRSLSRLILKYLGVSSSVYLQSKSGFAITTYILRDPEILTYMKNYINSCWVSKYVEMTRLDAFKIHNLFNICMVTNS